VLNDGALVGGIHADDSGLSADVFQGEDEIVVPAFDGAGGGDVVDGEALPGGTLDEIS
jgi:hypothetical protein